MKPKIIISFGLLILIALIFISIFTLRSLPSPKNGLGAVPSKSCQISNCHGLNLTCDSNGVTQCTALYQLGDRCRQFASCQTVNNQCQPVYSEEYNSCKTCVEKCSQNFPNDQIDLFHCESSC